MMNRTLNKLPKLPLLSGERIEVRGTLTLALSLRGRGDQVFPGNHVTVSFFTLIELAAVAAIMGIAVTMFIVRVDGVTPSARLGAAARLVGSSVELALSDAVMKREQRSVVYDLPGNTVRIEKKSEQDPTETIVLAERHLPVGVEIAEVEGAETEDGRAVILVSSSGRMAPHAAHLSNSAGEMTVEIYGLTGKVRYHSNRVSLREFTKESLTEEEE